MHYHFINNKDKDTPLPVLQQARQAIDTVLTGFAEGFLSPSFQGKISEGIQNREAFMIFYRAFPQNDPALVFFYPTYLQQHSTFIRKHIAFVFFHGAFPWNDPAFVFFHPAFMQKSPALRFFHLAFMQKFPALGFSHPAFIRKRAASVFFNPSFILWHAVFAIFHLAFMHPFPAFVILHPVFKEAISSIYLLAHGNSTGAFGNCIVFCDILSGYTNTCIFYPAISIKKTVSLVFPIHTCLPGPVKNSFFFRFREPEGCQRLFPATIIPEELWCMPLPSFRPDKGIPEIRICMTQGIHLLLLKQC
jgi:hypothetical protein